MENKGNLSIINLITAVIIGEIFGFRNKNIKAEFPNKIGSYKLKKIFKQSEINSRTFIFALYTNKNGEKALAKMWRGSVKDLIYYTLLNEIAVYKALNKVLERLSESIPREFKDVRIPKYLGFMNGRKSLLILTEYIEGVSAEKSFNSDAFEIYNKCSEFLKFLGSKMTKEEKKGISKRTVLSIFLLYPLFLARAITVRPRLMNALIKGMPIVANSLPGFLEKRAISLGHRDLQLKNIIISKKKLYILDLQFCIFSYELYDLFMALRTRFSDKSYRNEIFREVRKEFPHREDKNWIKGLMVICATHSLSGNNLPRRIEKNSINFLKFAIGEKNGKGYGWNILNNLKFNI